MAAPLHACVLHQHDWSESSLILELFTREQGRVVCVARGAKRPHSNFRPVLLPFQRLLVTLGRPPADGSEVHALRGAEWGGGRPLLLGGAVFAGFYLNELLMRLLARHDPHPVLYDAYVDTLAALGQADDESSQAALRAFELVLLRETGVLPELDRDTQTQQFLEPALSYRLSGEGLSPLGGPGGLSVSTLQALSQALDTPDLAALRRACTPALQALRSQLRACLHYHLGSSSLRTRQVMLDVQKLTGRDAEPATAAAAIETGRPDR